CTLVLQLVLGLAIAFLFDQLGRADLVRTVIVLPLAIPPTITALIFKLMGHSEFGVLSYMLYKLRILTVDEPLLGGTGAFALAAVMLADIWQWTPFMILIARAGLKSLPTDVVEAALVDGTTWWQRVR